MVRPHQRSRAVETRSLLSSQLTTGSSSTFNLSSNQRSGSLSVININSYSTIGSNYEKHDFTSTNTYSLTHQSEGIGTKVARYHNNALNNEIQPQPSRQQAPSRSHSPRTQLNDENIAIREDIDKMKNEVALVRDQITRYTNECDRGRVEHEKNKEALKKQISVCNFNLAKSNELSQMQSNGEFQDFQYLNQVNASSTSEDLIRYLRESERIIKALETKLGKVQNDKKTQNDKLNSMIRENQERIIELESTIVKFRSKKS